MRNIGKKMDIADYLEKAKKQNAGILNAQLFFSIAKMWEPFQPHMFDLDLEPTHLHSAQYQNSKPKEYTFLKDFVPNVKCLTLAMNASLLPLFFHQGMSSAMWFQPHVNERSLYVQNFLKKKKGQKCSLFQAAIDLEHCGSFNISTPISILPYVIVKRTENDGADDGIGIESVCSAIV